MKQIVIKGFFFLVLLLIPCVILLLLYIYFDPFKVVRKYAIAAYADSYSTIEPNRDYISTEIFLRNREKYSYNSFIFGSSRAIAFNPDSWVKHLDKQAIPFSFDSAGESIFGIYTKIKFLDKENIDLRNVLIVFCRGAFKDINNYNEHLIIKHPEVTGESWFKFHFVFFKAYFNLRFLLGYYSYISSGDENFLTKGIIQNKGVVIDFRTNYIKLDSWETQLKENPLKYYEARKNIFYKREGESFEQEQQIGERSLKMLNEIKEILDRHHSNYKIVLSPIYDQVKFSPKDKIKLHQIFGDQLYDFTGKNFITENDTNWYESFHFRPFIADSIMNFIYFSSNIGEKWR